MSERVRAAAGACAAPRRFSVVEVCGAPGRTRTDNIQLRRLALYPIELRARCRFLSLARERGGTCRRELYES